MEKTEDIFNQIYSAAEIIKKSKYLIAFTGAGISVESGIPTFRGKGGIYEKVSSTIFDLNFFYSQNKRAWYLLLKFIFLPLLRSEPNDAHKVLAKFESDGFIKATITQNIDTLHEKAGTVNLYKFHGTSDKFSCINCAEKYRLDDLFTLKQIDEIKKDKVENDIDPFIFESFNAPKCKNCGSIIKPQLVFFKEGIPEDILNQSFYHAQNSDCILIIGTSGVVYPAAVIPQIVHRNKGKIIEINPEPTEYTYSITDIFIQGSASWVLKEIVKKVY